MLAHNQQSSTGQPLGVFLCYSSKDKSIVRDFYRRLQTEGIMPWFDEEDLLPGQKWRTEIPKAVRAADVVLVCLSRNSVDRTGYAQKEIKLALDEADEQPEGSIFVIPVRLEECNIPDRLRERHWVNLFEARGYERLVKALRHRADQLGRVLPDSVDLSIGQPVVPIPYHPAHDIIPVLLRHWHESLAQRNELFGQPVDYWCYIRPGTYRIGGWEQGRSAAEITLGAFWIARFPITVAQYTPFVDVGYNEKAWSWWTPNGWLWKESNKRTQPWSWNQVPFNVPNQPVIGVTWYEATAFAAWLNTQLQYMLPSDYVIRLPTEAEWEVAAAYDVRGHCRPYPWGETRLTSGCAVFGREWEDAPPRVGSRPTGAAACGALDLVGTVWEATTSSFANYPEYSHIQRTDFTIDQSDVPWRGGSSWSHRAYIHCGGRSKNFPDHVSNDDIRLGFRMVLAPQ
jgi:formylglycine-generating enzyme required for sulfatase activity